MKHLPNVYSFTDYKKYLQKWIESRPVKGRGVLSSMAKHLRSQSSFLSQVLSGTINLSAEQAFDLSSFLALTEEERDYFLLLISLARAGSSNLRSHLKKQVELAREAGFKIRVKAEIPQVLSAEDQQTYYSAWYYAVIHIAITVSQLQRTEDLSKTLGLRQDLVQDVVEFLIEKDLVRRQKDHSLTFGNCRLHLDWNSSLQAKHHSNFRLLAINTVDRGIQLDNLHYSSVVSLTKEDYQNIRDSISSQIRAIRQKVKDSEPAEELVCFSVDFFKIRS